MVPVSTLIRERAARAAAESGGPLPDPRRTAIVRIARLHGETRKVAHRGVADDPYGGDGSRIDIYADDQGYEYWTDPADGRIVQMGPAEDRHQKALADRPAGGLAVHELRERATAAVTGQLPWFPERRSSLHPLEDNYRKRIYYFRWDDLAAPSRESEMPPFVQIGLWADGTVASYTDTLSR